MVPEAPLESSDGGLVVGSCAIVAVGTRRSREVVYPVSELALKYGAGAEQETREPDEAYAGYQEDVATQFRDDWLPGR